jgi:hypothetical protein
LRENLAQREEVRIPSATLKNGEEPPMLGSERYELGGIIGRDREWLVDDNMFSRRQGFASEFEMRGIRRGDYDQINFRQSESFVGTRQHSDVVVLPDFRTVARNNMGELQAGHVREQRGMKGLTGKSVSEQSNI